MHGQEAVVALQRGSRPPWVEAEHHVVVGYLCGGDFAQVLSEDLVLHAGHLVQGASPGPGVMKLPLASMTSRVSRSSSSCSWLSSLVLFLGVRRFSRYYLLHPPYLTTRELHLDAMRVR